MYVKLMLTYAIKVKRTVLNEPMNLTTNLKVHAVAFNSKNITIFKIICSDNSFILQKKG